MLSHDIGLVISCCPDCFLISFFAMACGGNAYHLENVSFVDKATLYVDYTFSLLLLMPVRSRKYHFAAGVYAGSAGLMGKGRKRDRYITWS